MTSAVALTPDPPSRDGEPFDGTAVLVVWAMLLAFAFIAAHRWPPR